MARTETVASNPFALMMTPEVVLQAIEGSARLDGLARRVYRPLDRPVIPKGGKGKDTDAFDREVELSDE